MRCAALVLAALAAGAAAADPLGVDALHGALGRLGGAGGEALRGMVGLAEETLEKHASALDMTVVAGGLDALYCPNKTAFEFIPATTAQLKPTASASPAWDAGCFSSTTATLDWAGAGEVATVTFVATGAQAGLCGDLYFVHSGYQSVGIAMPSTLSGGKATVTFTPTAAEAAYVSTFGLAVMLVPCGVSGSVASLLDTVTLFDASNATQLRDANAAFLHRVGVWPELEVFDRVVDVNVSALRSGDSLAIARFDGLDPMVMFGTGGQTGHVATLVWDADELYVVESTAANPFGFVYWPAPYGVIRTPWAKWVALAVKADYHVDVLPLKPELSAAFNESAYWAWFSEVQGMPYGFHTFITVFVDTSLPLRNLPAPMESSTTMALLAAWDRLQPGTAGGSVGVQSNFIDAFNHRMDGTTCTNMTCVTGYLVAHNMTVGQLASIPELDAWRYAGNNYSMVCSEFASRNYKASGVMEAAGVAPSAWQAAEFAPKDLYQLALYDPARFDNTTCPDGGLQASGLCQIMGFYTLDLATNAYNTVQPYAGMNERCPAQYLPDDPAMSYFRCPASNNQCC